MGWKYLAFLFIVMVLVSGCSGKTKPVVSDVTQITGEAVKEDIKEESTLEEIKENITVPEEEQAEEQTGEPKLQNVHEVLIKDLRLEPQELTIKIGETVVWKHEDKWEGVTKHAIAAHNNEFRSPMLYFGETFNHTFNRTGTFTYIDVVYKERDFMRGKIIVEE